jgi:hypothetical protein
VKTFLAAMTGLSHGANMAIAFKLAWTGYKTLAQILHLCGIGFDLAEVGPIFEEYVEMNGVKPVVVGRSNSSSSLGKSPAVFCGI